MRTYVLVVCLASCLTLTGCLGSSAPLSDGGADRSANLVPDDDGGLGDGAVDLGRRAQAMLDFAGVDLAGRVNCFNLALCDPAMQEICVQWYAGTKAAPGAMGLTTGCYQPSQPNCNGQPLTCACLKSDPTLGANCKECTDNPDNTHICYAQ